MSYRDMVLDSGMHIDAGCTIGEAAAFLEQQDQAQAYEAWLADQADQNAYDEWILGKEGALNEQDV